MLRIVSKCSSLEEFVAVFSRFCDRESIFVVTREPRPVGTHSRFAITLSDGTPMIVGAGEVTEAHRSKDNQFGRPGMRLLFGELDDSSRKTVERVYASRVVLRAPPPLPRHIRPRTAPGVVPPAAAELAAETEAKKTASTFADNERTTETNPPERRAGSDFILPANPFGDLTDSSLEAFVECTLYEESGMVQAAPERPGSSGEADLPGWWPRSDSETLTPPPVDPSAPAPPGSAPIALGPPPQGFPPMSAGPVGAAPMARPPEPTELVPRIQPAPQWRVVIAAALVAAAVSLGAGYLIWGGDAQTPAQAATAETADDQSESPAEPQPEPAAAVNDGDADEPAAVERDDLGGDEDLGGQWELESGEAPGEEPEDELVAAEAQESDDGALLLEEGECMIRVTSSPEGALVYAGRKRLGTTPLERSLPCEVDELELRRSRYQTTTERVALVPGETADVQVGLRRPNHTLQVQTKPAGARVTVGGRAVGTTPVTTRVPGFLNHEVVVSLAGHQTWRRRVYTKDQTTTLRVRLRPGR